MKSRDVVQETFEELASDLAYEMLTEFKKDVCERLFDWSNVWNHPLVEDSDDYRNIEKMAVKILAKELLTNGIE